jgi:hypothetical protein
MGGNADGLGEKGRKGKGILTYSRILPAGAKLCFVPTISAASGGTYGYL